MGDIPFLNGFWRMDIVNGYDEWIFMEILIMKYMGYYTWILDINVFISC